MQFFRTMLVDMIFYTTAGVWADATTTIARAHYGTTGSAGALWWVFASLELYDSVTKCAGAASCSYLVAIYSTRSSHNRRLSDGSVGYSRLNFSGTCCFVELSD